MNAVDTTNARNQIKPRAYASSITRIARTILSALGRILALILALLLGLPTILLPFATSVPAPVWILLIVADSVLLGLQFRVRHFWWGLLYSLGGVIVVSILAILASQYFARTPLVTDAQGNPLPGSIATLEKVNLNGSEQWISIRGKDVNNPVLLFLAGGPGGSQLVTARYALAGLEDDFVVVNWEQPGAGKSFDAINRSTLTPERYISDGLELASYLRERFDEEKIYVLGESWGSALGIWMVQREPESFHAFIGTGQMVAFLETDQICYEFALRWAQERGDTKKVEKLIQQGPPPYYGRDMALKEAAYLVDTFAFMNQDPEIIGGFDTLRDLAGSEYGLYDKVNWVRGPLETLSVVYPHLWNVDFREQATELDVPVYFLIGRHDVNAPPALTEEYYSRLNAPQKELIWFEHSGHNPWTSEPTRFVEVVVNTVLAETYPIGD